MLTSVDIIRARTRLQPVVGLVLGSGLGSFADKLERAARIPYAHLAELPASTAIGHAGELVIGTIGNTPVAVMSGRFHLYEGYTPQQTVAGIRLFRQLGIQRIILTNAAGSINPSFERGSLVVIADHINLQGVNPLSGPNDPRLGPRFPDMTEAYSKRLRDIAKTLGMQHEGVYAALLGPSYETPAEIRYLRTIGADLVGMSTAAEAIAANHAGMEVLGISCVTNVAAGLGEGKLDHQEVLETGRSSAELFSTLLQSLIPRLHAL